MSDKHNQSTEQVRVEPLDPPTPHLYPKIGGSSGSRCLWDLLPLVFASLSFCVLVLSAGMWLGAGIAVFTAVVWLAGFVSAVAMARRILK